MWLYQYDSGTQFKLLFSHVHTHTHTHTQVSTVDLTLLRPSQIEYLRPSVGDVDLDGFPDILVPAVNNKSEWVAIVWVVAIQWYNQLFVIRIPSFVKLTYICSSGKVVSIYILGTEMYQTKAILDFELLLCSNSYENLMMDSCGWFKTNVIFISLGRCVSLIHRTWRWCFIFSHYRSYPLLLLGGSHDNKLLPQPLAFSGAGYANTTQAMFFDLMEDVSTVCQLFHHQHCSSRWYIIFSCGYCM